MQIDIASAQSRLRQIALGLLAEASVTPRTKMQPLDKWKIYRAVCAAKPRLGLSDRALAVLSGLLSFLPEPELAEGENLIVFPSNRQLALRAHGMAEATIRRHLASLIEAGLILRKDSPNGKRYARRNSQGDIQRAFGFSLAPLLSRFEEFEAMARAIADERERRNLLREAITLHRRDIEALLAHAAEMRVVWSDDISNRIASAVQPPARSSDANELAAAEQGARLLKEELVNSLKSHNFRDETSGTDRHIERHKESPKPDLYLESEGASQKHEGPSQIQASVLRNVSADRQPKQPMASLAEILTACPEIKPYGPSSTIRSFEDLSKAAFLVRHMLRISDKTFSLAIDAMGMERTAITIACLLERSLDISHPDAYLRDLVEKASRGTFTPKPMLQALLRARRLQTGSFHEISPLSELNSDISSVNTPKLSRAKLLEMAGECA